ncbi:uncharacterized protein [Dendrobates tinctorius]|uniref:uncharacterized protein n=1 Tax=Dendrobates tinctorius TaxID=92724 RepID=UPI003CC992B8
MVCGTNTASRRRPLATSRSLGSAFSGPDLPPELQGPVFDGMAVESWSLTQAGFSLDVISTMISARKPVSRRIYHRTWKIFFSWCKDHGRSPLVFFIAGILEFLQSGLKSGLVLSSLKAKFRPCQFFSNKELPLKPQVKTFIQGVSHVTPPYRRPLEPWDLSLVLGALQEDPFEPLQDVSLTILSWKVVFLVAITSIRQVSELAALSCRSPFLNFHQDKVVLKTSPSFLPKVVSSFHLNEEIVSLSFCTAPVHRIEKALHTLDVVRALRRYMSRTAPFRKSDALFILPEGHRKGLAVSKATLGRWIRSAIQESYSVRNSPVPAGIKAHSTRSVGASWAIRHRPRQKRSARLRLGPVCIPFQNITKFILRPLQMQLSADASCNQQDLRLNSEVHGVLADVCSPPRDCFRTSHCLCPPMRRRRNRDFCVLAVKSFSPSHSLGGHSTRPV